MEPVTLYTDRLVLRPFTPDDADAVHTACQDPDIPRWTPVPSTYTPQHARVFVEETVPRGWSEDTSYTLAVCRKDDGALVSAMGLVRLRGLETPLGGLRTAELGYWTAPDQRRLGFTAEAAREVCRWGLEDLGAERLEWFAEAGHVASRAVALRVGFVPEGTVRSFLLHNGTRRDAWSASLLPSDWGLPQAAAYLPHAGG